MVFRASNNIRNMHSVMEKIWGAREECDTAVSMPMLGQVAMFIVAVSVCIRLHAPIRLILYSINYGTFIYA